MIAYLDSSLPSEDLKVTKRYKTLEIVEEELNDVSVWASLKKQIFIITGDLNLDRRKPESSEGKILADLKKSAWNAMLNYQADED